MKTLCIGRFQVFTPDTLAVAGRTQSIYRTEVSTAPIRAGGAQRAWQERVSEIRAQDGNDPVRRTFDLAPGVPAVWYGINPRSPSAVVLEAVKPADDHWLKLVRRSEAGKESMAEKLVRNILASYVPHETRYGFCIGQGSLTIQPAERESVSLTLKHQTLGGIEFGIETATVDRPDEEGSGLDEAQAFAKSTGARLTVLRDQKRNVAGLTGDELRISLAPPAEAEILRFHWHYPGTAGDPTRPKIDISGSSPPAERRELEHAWDSLLDSLRPVPLEKR